MPHAKQTKEQRTRLDVKRKENPERYKGKFVVAQKTLGSVGENEWPGTGFKGSLRVGCVG